MDMKHSSVATKFITTGYPENRTNVYLKIEENNVDEANQNLIRIENHKGRFKPANTTIHEKYGMRPEALSDMFLAQFAINFESCKIPENQTFIEGISTLINGKNNNLPKYIILHNGTCMKSK